MPRKIVPKKLSVQWFLPGSLDTSCYLPDRADICRQNSHHSYSLVQRHRPRIVRLQANPLQLDIFRRQWEALVGSNRSYKFLAFHPWIFLIFVKSWKLLYINPHAIEIQYLLRNWLFKIRLCQGFFQISRQSLDMHFLLLDIPIFQITSGLEI